MRLVTIYIVRMGVLGSLLVWIGYGVSLFSALGFDGVRSQIAVGSSWAAIAVLYITSASLRAKNIDPNFWVPDE